MELFKSEALAILANFENNSAKEALIELVEYTVNREKWYKKHYYYPY